LELADSHAHLDMDEFDADREQVVDRAWAAGVRALLCPADLTEPASLSRVLELHRKYGWIVASAGIHPHQARDFLPQHLDRIAALAGAGTIVALGEVGLDFHYNFSPAAKQKEALRAQLALAGRLRLPAVVHSRNSGGGVIAAVEAEKFECGGVLHCFTEDWETARRMIELGFFVSFSGILTFPNAHLLREVARKIPPDRLLIETDSPFLVPAPRRGRDKRNEPAFVVETARFLAELRGMTLPDLALLTFQNFHDLFFAARN
jgi:TatD DNase family protein